MRLGPPDAESNNYLMIGRGYDAYDLWDLGEFHQKGTVGTRWGTREELLSACALAKLHNVDILIDAVLNHKMGGDRVETFMAVPCNPQNRLKPTGPVREIQVSEAPQFAPSDQHNITLTLNRAGLPSIFQDVWYSSFVWTQQHFTGVDWDDKTRQNEIYRIVGSGHKGWSNHVDNELGNYDYLLGLDIDFRHPAVREDLMKWGPWILETTGASGFRLDAIKHIDQRFLLEFIQTVRKRSGMPKMFAVSEYWSGE
ncbi:hypothetical protein ONZ45_g18867 [Pleurotus djamor]|nr:hypothetical protein ONZ45_g18867 [Pleurotus djamor]